MIGTNNTRKHSMTILIAIVFVLVLLFDVNNSSETHMLKENSLMSEAGQYILPETKLLMQMVMRFFDLISNSMPST